jgi:hypothetical protein
MAADRKNWLVDLGTTDSYPLQYQDDSGNPVDLTGYNLQFKVTKPGDGTDIYFEQFVEGNADGTATFIFDDEETSTWEWRKGAYTVDLIDPDGNPLGLVYGTFTVRDRADVS